MATFIGRQAELEAIDALVRDAVRGRHPAALLITGDPGVGKSRLLVEARSRLPRVTALTVTGYEAEQTVPLAAASELLARLAATPAGETLHHLVQGPAAPAAAPLEPLRLFEAALKAAQAACRAPAARSYTRRQCSTPTRSSTWSAGRRSSASTA